MRDVFPDEAAELKSAGEYPVNDADAARIRDSLESQQVCPFCGVVSDGAHGVCAKCTMENSAVARKATKLRIGPWYVLQNRNPAAPGMKWETLLTFVRKGRVKPQSIVRGPTTHQLWRFAAHIKGLSREFGVCYSCGGSIEQGANLCAHCNRLQEPPVNPDQLLEGMNSSDAEPRLPIYKEISSNEVDAAPAALPAPVPTIDEEAIRRQLREEAEAAAAEMRQEVVRERGELERDKAAVARERDAFRREQEAITREKEAVAREKVAVERERATIARERETARREREAAAAAPVRENPFVPTKSPTPAPTPTPKPAPVAAPVSDTSVWDLLEPDQRRPETEPSSQTSRSQPFASPDRAAAQAPQSFPQNQKPKQPQRDGFLSAKDLAAAFKLNLATVPEYDSASAKRFQPTPAAPQQPASKSPKPAPAPSPVRAPIPRPTPTSVPAPVSRRPEPQPVVEEDPFETMGVTPPAAKARRLAILIPALAFLAFAVMVVARPEWRSKATKIWASVAGSNNSKPTVKWKLAAPASADSPDTNGPASPSSLSGIGAPAPLTPPTNASPARAVAPVRAPAIAATVPAVVPPVEPATVTNPPPAIDNTQLAQALYRSAKDAEVHRDFAEAARLFDEIMRLPRASWPDDDIEGRAKLNHIQAIQK